MAEVCGRQDHCSRGDQDAEGQDIEGSFLCAKSPRRKAGMMERVTEHSFVMIIDKASELVPIICIRQETY